MVMDKDLLKWDAGHGHRFTHDLFRFPGKFHPPLVEHILRTFDPTGVVDPMAGVGTVAVEAKAAGIPSLSLDIDPVSSFFTRVKTTPIPTDALEGAWKDLSSALVAFRRSKDEIERRKFSDIRHDILRKGLDEVQARELERLAFWFRRYCLLDYARIDHAIFNGGLPNRNANIRRFFWACLLSSIRRISLADPQPVSGLEITKRMKEKLEHGWPINVFGEFERRVQLGIARMAQYNNYLVENGTTATPTHIKRIDCADIAKVTPDGFRPNLIFFSPPYCTAIEYWRRHRLEYFLGGFLTEEEASALKRKFIGRTLVGNLTFPLPKLGIGFVDTLIRDVAVGRTIKDPGRKARILWQYFKDMDNRLKNFYSYLPSGGHCVIVVGDSTTAGHTIRTGRALARFGEKAGFEYVKTSRYIIKNRVMQYPTNNAKIEKESIIVLEKK
jgi:hypothetical protein